MDVNAALCELNGLIEQIGIGGARRSARGRELIEAIDNWIKGGGFEPDWDTYPKAAELF